MHAYKILIMNSLGVRLMSRKDMQPFETACLTGLYFPDLKL